MTSLKRESGITEATIRANRLTFGSFGMTIPYRDLNGVLDGFSRTRLRHPQGSQKYHQAKGTPLRAYFPAASLPLLRDGTSDIHITEGEKKAMALGQLGLAAVGIGGIWCGCKRGTEELLADLQTLPMEGRRVFLSFDNDGDPQKLRMARMAAWRLTGALRKAGCKEVRYIELPPAARGCKVAVDDFLVAQGPEAFMELVEKAKPIEPGTTIWVDAHLKRMTGQAIEALANAEDLYVSGGNLVRIIELAEPEENQSLRIIRPAGSLKIVPLTAATLADELSQYATFLKMGKDGKPHPVPPPKHTVHAVLDQKHWPELREIDAVVSYPILLLDGSLLDREGYHPESRLYLAPLHGMAIRLRPSPTLTDARQARDLLLDVVCDFPFAKPAHKAAWLAGLLTPLAWFAFGGGPAPLTLIDGNTAGCGKGLLADATAMILLGHPFSRAGYSSRPNETEQLITACAMVKDSCVLLDNISGKFGDPALDRALTAAWWKQRLLGGNQLYDGPLSIAWYGTGNNVELSADQDQRTLHVRIESPLEEPRKRPVSELKYPDLLGHVGENRGKLLSAALTILRAFIVAGRPDQELEPWGSFEGWSGLVRQAVKWVGLPDPGKTREDLPKRPDKWAIASVLDCLKGHPQGLSSGQLIEVANKVAPALKEALEALCPNGVNPVSLGSRLSGHLKQNIGGAYLDQKDIGGNKKRWVRLVSLVSLSVPQPESRENLSKGDGCRNPNEPNKPNPAGSNPAKAGGAVPLLPQLKTLGTAPGHLLPATEGESG
jgi:hypothetical protein